MLSKVHIAASSALSVELALKSNLAPRAKPNGVLGPKQHLQPITNLLVRFNISFFHISHIQPTSSSSFASQPPSRSDTHQPTSSQPWRLPGSSST